jgi:hypothetical protein
MAAPLGAGVVGEAGWALARRAWPLGAGCDSFPWLLPMASAVGGCRSSETAGSGTRRAVYGRRGGSPNGRLQLSASVRAGIWWLSGEISEWMGREVVVWQIAGVTRT